MAGVAPAQQPEMEDETMRDASLLLSLNGSRPDSVFASSPGDPMDISPAPATEQQHQHTSEASAQHVAQPQTSGQNSDSVPRSFSAVDDHSLSSAFDKVSPGAQSRRTTFHPPSRFSPKDRASLRQGQLKRIPLAMQAKLPTPMKLPVSRNNFAGGNRNFRPLSTNPPLPPLNQHDNIHFITGVSSSTSLGFNHLRNFPNQNRPPSRQLLSADPMSTNTNFATGAGGGTGDQATHDNAAPTTATTGNAGSEGRREVTGGPFLQRKRLIEEDNGSDVHRPTTYVSPKYRKISQPISPVQGSQKTIPTKGNSHTTSSQQQLNIAPTTSNLISPFKPNLSISKPGPVLGENNPKPTEGWCDMLELNGAFREQGITSPKVEPPKENTSNQDSFKENPRPFRYSMPGSWPDDPLDPPESIQEGSCPPAQSPCYSRDHGSLISCALVAPSELASKNAKPVTSTVQESQVPHVSRDAEKSEAHALKVAPEGQSEVSSQPSVSWWDQLHWIYTSSWEATQSIVTTAFALANSVKQRTAALFEPRHFASRRPTTATTKSSSPTRVNIRTLPEEQRRRLKSNQWRKERGFPTMEDYPFPQLSLDIPRLPATTTPSKPETPKPETPANRNRHARKRGASPVKGTKTKSGVQKRPLVQSLSPNMAKRMHMRPKKKNLIRTRLDRSLLHAVQSGKLALDEIPIAPAHDITRKQKPRPKREGPKKVRFVLESAPQEDPSLVGQHLHPGRIATKPIVEEEKENELPKPVISDEPHVVDPGAQSWLQHEFPFGRPMSAVRLFGPKKPLPPGRTESIYAAEWRKIEEEEKQKQIPARIRVKGPAVRPLPAKWEARLAEIKAFPHNRQVATTLSGDPLTKRDLETCYMPMAWLNDEVINAYLALLVDYLRQTNGNAGRHDKPKFHAFNTFFFSNLRDKGYASVSRWARRAKIGGEALLSVDTVYIPVHNSAHWTLMVVKPTSRTIEYFDSLGAPPARHVAKIKEWLRGELSGYDDGEWEVVPSVSPQQDNGSDCGAFLLSTAKAVAVGIEPVSYGPKDIPLLRRKIVAELMSGGLTGDFSPEGETGDVLM